MTTLLLALVALLGFVSSASGQSTEAPTRLVGDTWTLSDGRVITTIKAEDGWTSATGSLRDCPTCIVRVDKDLNFDGVVLDASGKPVDPMKLRGVGVGPGWKFFEWPLEVGKQWRFSATSYVNQRPVRSDVVNTVKAFEQVKTKAGTFQAYKIQRDWSRENPFGPAFTWSDTTWYAPDAKFAVKFTSTGRNAVEWELVSYTVK
jgi:hypothetical protein